jgi:hypothetical protein
MGPEPAHRLEDDSDAPRGRVFGQGVKAFGGAGKLVGRRAAALDDARVPVETTGVGGSAKLGGQVDLTLVPGEAAGAVSWVVGREVAVERPKTAGADDELEAERSGAPSGQARVEDDVVADGELEHVQAHLPGEVEKMQVAVRPAPGEEVTVGAVFHGGKIPHLRVEFKPEGEGDKIGS